MDWKERIRIDPKACHGIPCVKGMRIWVSLVWDFLASGGAVESIIQEYPQLTCEEVLVFPGAVYSGRRHCEPMKFELNGNFGPTARSVFRRRGLDRRTVFEKSLGGQISPEHPLLLFRRSLPLVMTTLLAVTVSDLFFGAWLLWQLLTPVA